MINEAIKQSVITPGLSWIVAPSYRQVKAICWNRLKALLKVDAAWKFNEQELSAEHPQIGTRIELKGADNEDSLRGIGLRSAYIDEAASIKPNVWPEIIRPMLADHRGRALFIGTPKGKNWFYDLYMEGVDGNPDFKCWDYPTSINKYIHADEIAQMQKDMPERLYRQEVLAEFLDESTGVFKGIRQCIVGEEKPPITGRMYVLGVDLAKTYDFTVLVVMDSTTREVVAFERFQDVSWTEQKHRIQQLAGRYNNALTIIDSTGVGDPIVDDLRVANISLFYEDDKPGYKFTNESKKRLIENLVIAIEQRLITFPRIEPIIDELQNYDYKLLSSGRIEYGAPEGKHDDCVTALALACWAIRHSTRSAQVLIGRSDNQIIDRQGRGTPVLAEQSYEFRGY